MKKHTVKYGAVNFCQWGLPNTRLSKRELAVIKPTNRHQRRAARNKKLKPITSVTRGEVNG